MLIPSVIAAFFAPPFRELTFVAELIDEPFLSASDTFAVMLGGDWLYVWPTVLVALTQVIAAALVMSTMDKHFRSGRLSLRSPLKLINFSVFPMLIGVAAMGAVSIVLRIVLFGVVSLVQAIAHSASLPAGAATAVIAGLAVGVFVLHIVIIMPMLFWSPLMFVYGYRFRDAAAASFQLISGKKLFPALLLPLVMPAGLQLLVAFLDPHYAVWVTVSFLLFLVTNVYVTVYVMIAFYAISELDRRDIKPYKAPPLPQRKPEQKKEERNEKEQPAPQDPPETKKSQENKKPPAKKKKPTTAPEKPVKPPAKNARRSKEGEDGV